MHGGMLAATTTTATTAATIAAGTATATAAATATAICHSGYAGDYHRSSELYL